MSGIFNFCSCSVVPNATIIGVNSYSFTMIIPNSSKETVFYSVVVILMHIIDVYA